MNVNDVAYVTQEMWDAARSMEIVRMASANEIGKMPCSEPQSAARSEGGEHGTD